MRLLVWGREWGVVEGRLEAHLQAESEAGNERLRPLAVQILTELYSIMTDFSKLQDKYGLREEPETVSEKLPARKRASATSRLRDDLQLKARWVIADKEKFGQLLRDLKDYNDGLEKLFPNTRLATLQRTWQNELLQGAQRDLAKLNLLESASSGVYPRLNASANLKQLRINLDAESASSFKPTHALKIQRHLLLIKDKEPRRSLGSYQNPSTGDYEHVVVEWIDYDKDDVDVRVSYIQRIDDLAQMVHSASNRHPDLQTIDCLGYMDDSVSSRYGLVYRAPAPSFSSLNSLISSKEFRTPDLGERFRLAHTLAVALWSFHSLDWLHKSVSSANILFFPSAFSASATQPTASAATIPNISSPILLGFDSSRPDQEIEFSVASRNSSSMDLHRHPDSLAGLSRKPYCKSYDIYSLGLVLWEIGAWKVLQDYHKPHYTAQRFRDKVVLNLLVPGLSSKTGSLYRELVERCLAARDDMTAHESGSLMEHVVSTLESLNV